MKKKILLLMLLLAPCLSCANDLLIANALKEIAEKTNIDKKVLYTLSKIESNFNPYVISFTSKEKNFRFSGLNSKIVSYKRKNLITLSGKEKDLQRALKILIKKGYKVDVGLMQINSVNFKENEIPYIFNVKYNIAKGANILKQCIDYHSTLKNSIECYNKGNKKFVTYNYYHKFKKNYNKDFGGI